MQNVKRLEAGQLIQRCDPGQLLFENTDELEGLEDTMLGQPRAAEAMQFGMGIERDGYNFFALGPTGLGKRDFVQDFFERRAKEEAVPADWCYVNNFEDGHKPNAISLPAGKGVAFRDDMDELIDELDAALSAAFDSEEYQSRRQSITEEFQERQSEAFSELRRKAEEKGIGLIRTPAGLAFAPIRDGEVLSPEEVQNLPEEEQQRMQEDIQELQEELQKILQQVPTWQKKMQERMRELNREMAHLAVGGLIDELREEYSDYDEVVEFLDRVEEDVVENAQQFLGGEQQQQNPLQALVGGGGQPGRQESLTRRYRVNLLVDNSETEGAPVLYEDNPTYQNLIGRIEHRAQMGALFTDFNLIKSGSLHRANGGYLLLNARDVLMQPYAWDALKRALQAERLRIESLGQRLGLISTVSLEPESIPLDIKVALIGERLLYYLLWQLDPDFAELFKVEVDFEDQMDRSDENQQLYCRLIGTMVQREKLQPFDRAAVARVIEHSSRLVGDAEKLSTHMQDVRDLLRQSDYWARDSGNGVVTADDVQKAIDAAIYRADRVRERVHEAILRDTLLIDSEGKEVGQINGLSILQLGGFMFGRPTRITAQLRLGKGDVVDIEREVELSGPIHSKGVLILAGFLGGRYATDKPLALSASLVFEQSYSGVEGDSASSAELYALLSAIAEVPIQQNLAVTGSVNQRGKVQAIGGVNQKIEGFFDICKARGLTGDQGVLIPASNVKNLMLQQRVVDAVEAGDFHIYPVETVDQGIEILTGMPAGERDEEGNYPEDTINYLVEKRLAELAERRAKYAERVKEGPQ